MAKKIKTGWISDFKGECAYAPKTLLDQVLFKKDDNKLIQLNTLIDFQKSDKKISIINPYDNNNKLSLTGSIQIEGDIHLTKESNCLNLIDTEAINLNSFKINPKISGNYYKFDISNNNKLLSVGIGSNLEKVNFSKNDSKSILEIGDNSLTFETNKIWIGNKYSFEAERNVKITGAEDLGEILVNNKSFIKFSGVGDNQATLIWGNSNYSQSICGIKITDDSVQIGNNNNIVDVYYPYNAFIIGTEIDKRSMGSTNLYSVLMGHNIKNNPSGICIGNKLNIVTKYQNSIQNNAIAIGYNIQGSVEYPSEIDKSGLNILIGNDIEGYGIDSIAIGNGAKIGGRNEEDELIYPKQAIQLGQGTNMLGGLQVHGYRLLGPGGQLVINPSALFNNVDDLINAVQSEDIEVGTMFFVLNGYVNN